MRGVLVGVALAACAGAHARDGDLGTMSAWDTPAYTLIAAQGHDPRPLMQRFANVERVLSKMLATPVRATGVPTTVWLAPPGIWGRYLAPSRDIVGEFVPRRFANYLIINASLRGAHLRGGLQHEYTHFFLRTQFGGLYPLWFDEGMAGLMYSTELHRNSATILVPVNIDKGAWVPMARLFVIDKSSREYLEQPASDAVHRESWALMHRSLIAETAFGAKMFAYLSAINRLVPVEDAAQDSFGMTFPQLDAEMQRYLGSDLFAVARLPYESAPPVRLPARRAIGPTEVRVLLARVMLDTGFNLGRVRELIDAAEQLEPGAPALAVLRLRLAVRDRNDAEMTRLADSLERSDDAVIVRGLGLALFERVREEAPEDPLPATQRAAIAQRAFGLLDRALAADPADAESAWGYALLAAGLQTRLDIALTRLAAVDVRLPDHPDLAEARARILEARGDGAAMLPALLTVLRHTSSAKQRAWAAQRIRELRTREREQAPQ